jgi:predicted metal-dependent hydrolase
MDRGKNGRLESGMSQLQLPFHDHPPRAGSAGLRRLLLSTGVLHYRFVRSRRRTIGIYVHRGEVEARAPRYVAVAEVEAFIREKERWITRRLAQAAPEAPMLRWSEGESLPVLGRAARLTAGAESAEVHLTDDRLMLPPQHIARWRELTLDWLRRTALSLFHERVRHFASALGVREPSLGLSNAKTQWGSCWRKRGETGRVLLNWRLVLLPAHIADYVVAHELAHLRELNHSPRFWAVVAQLYPDYRAARRELNRLGSTLPTL